MKRVLLIGGCVALVTVAVRGTDAGYTNFATMNCNVPPPQIDARVFVNEGTFCGSPAIGNIGLGQFFFFGGLSVLISNPGLSYGTLNTLAFTNRGIMLAAPGFELDYVTDDGFHHPASAIFNGSGGASGPAIIDGGRFMLLSATNLINRGLLEVGGFGLMQLKGQNVNLSHSGILVDPASQGSGGCFFSYVGWLTSSNYFPEFGLYDEYWGVGSVTNLASDRIAQQFGTQLIVQSPVHNVTNLARPMGFGTRLAQMVDPAAFVSTNIVVNGTNTNWVVQAVFVGNLDATINTQVRFADNTYPENLPSQNGMRSAIVELTSLATNIVTGATFNYTLYLTDQLAASTNRNSLTNVFFGTQRPAPYILNSIPPCDFYLGSVGPNTTFTDTLFYDPNLYSNRVVTADYAGYEALVFPSSAPVGFPFGYPSNSPGRVEITASNLDLSHTRIRGETIVNIKTPHLVGSAGALIEAPTLNYDLGSTNGLLSISGKDLLSFSEVRRFGGVIRAWSAVWTNFANVVSDSGTNMTTNAIPVLIHACLVDAAGMATIQPTLINDFSAHGTNIVLNDAIGAGGAVNIDGDSLTVNGILSFTPPATWSSANVHLNNLTNNGTINIPDVMTLGDASRPYKSVVNSASGSINTVSMSITADLLENTGSIAANAALDVNVRTVKLEGGTLSAGGSLSISAQDIKLTRYQQSSAELYLSPTVSLADNGPAANNTLVCFDGFNLLTKPPIGDLLGTTLESQIPNFRAVDHTWAAEDRGATAAGYTNNAAIGHLTFNVPINSFGMFSGIGASNALYIDFLELGGAALTDLQSVMAINTDLVIYFAGANVDVETLDGQFADSLKPAGRLRWVSSFAGPNTTVDVLLLNGQTIQTNRALRFSQTIDSDGDGVVNALDFYPFDAAAWNSVQSTNSFWNNVAVTGSGPSRAVTLSWNGTANTVYHLEYTTNLSPANWQPLMNYTNVAVTNGVVTLQDKNLPAGESQRYYRMRFGP